MNANVRHLLYRALQLFLLSLLVYGFAQTLPFDLAALFAGDMLVYVEVATAVWLAAQVTRIRLAWSYGRRVLPVRWRSARRKMARARRAMTRRLARRADSDEDRPWGALVPA